LQAQTEKDIEVVVVDDCSTDATPEIVKHLAGLDTRIIYVRNDVKLGAGESRNKGHRLATAPIIAVCDDDDMYPDWRAAKTLEFFSRARGKTILNGSYIRIGYENGPDNTVPRNRFEAIPFDYEAWKQGRGGVYFCNPSAAFHRDNMPVYGAETDACTDDHLMLERWINEGGKIEAVKDVLCYHRVLPGSMMTKLRGGSLS